ncbi:MAG: septation ring formation regulator EzrA [Bacilli bacterium]|nr:septation ring formation regulator EzrA [Bacilli bacterium]
MLLKSLLSSLLLIAEDMLLEEFVVILFISIGSVILVGFVLFILFKFGFKRTKCKRQLKDLDKKVNYLKGLLTGQDASGVRRLEVISRSNLLYGDIYDEHQNDFKVILEDYSKPADLAINRLRTALARKDYKSFKILHTEAKKVITSFEDKLLLFDKDLYEILKPEEDLRSEAVRIKEDYRNIKQRFSNNTKELEMIAGIFNKVFSKIDVQFDKFEHLLECADYSEAKELLPKIAQVITALGRAISELPNLCQQIEKIIPEKIMLLSTDFIDVEKTGIPLFHLAYKKRIEAWQSEIKGVKDQLSELKLSGAQAKLDSVSNEIDDLHKQLEEEITDKKYFEQNINNAYESVLILEKDFLKIVAKLPEINSVYVVSPTQKTNLDVLKQNINELGVAKRALDNYIHSATKQPYSILKNKLEQLINDYEVAKRGVDDFKAYVESIKGNSEDAYDLVFNYYYKLKKVESVIRDMNMPNITGKYLDPIERCYGLLNAIDGAVKTQPIDVKFVNEKVEELKNITKNLFEDVEKQLSDMKLAESAIVYNNQDRIHQSDVHNKLLVLEDDFYNGEFAKVYKYANEIYQNSHVEDKK